MLPLETRRTGIRHRFVQLALVGAVLTAAFSAAVCEAQPGKSSEPPDATPDTSSALGGFGQLLQSSGDLRSASQSLENFGQSMERVSGPVAQGMESVSSHMAVMSAGFDPLGLQHAFRTIQLQSTIIQQQQERIEAMYEQDRKRMQRRIRQLKRKLKEASADTSDDPK